MISSIAYIVGSRSAQSSSSSSSSAASPSSWWWWWSRDDNDDYHNYCDLSCEDYRWSLDQIQHLDHCLPWSSLVATIIINLWSITIIPNHLCSLLLLGSALDQLLQLLVDHRDWVALGAFGLLRLFRATLNIGSLFVPRLQRSSLEMRVMEDNTQSIDQYKFSGTFGCGSVSKRIISSPTSALNLSNWT